MSFLHNLYKILEHNDLETVIQLSNSSHDVFKAHFPGNPVLPGFLQIDLFEELFNITITGIKKAKFLHFITPNMIISIQKKENKISVYHKNKIKISEIIYE
ncbi:MAG: hypothetical protein AB7V28_04975 [Arcobacteraceae bacterium]|jgi:3-hydroxyacyl-[acyl-carrier-protein] dehydratase